MCYKLFLYNRSISNIVYSVQYIHDYISDTDLSLSHKNIVADWKQKDGCFHDGRRKKMTSTGSDIKGIPKFSKLSDKVREDDGEHLESRTNRSRTGSKQYPPR